MSIPLRNNKIALATPEGVSVYADTLPVPTADTSGRTGWLYTKTGLAEKLNYYYYSEGSKPVTFATLQDIWFVGSVENWVNVSSCPFIVVYSKMQGDGQDGGLWYRTKRTFQISSNTIVEVGERTQFVVLEQPLIINENTKTPDFPYSRVYLTEPTVVGPNDPTEEILTIAVHTDSGAADTTKVLISHVGWGRVGSAVNCNILLSA